MVAPTACSAGAHMVILCFLVILGIDAVAPSWGAIFPPREHLAMFGDTFSCDGEVLLALSG